MIIYILYQKSLNMRLNEKGLLFHFHIKNLNFFLPKIDHISVNLSLNGRSMLICFHSFLYFYKKSQIVRITAFKWKKDLDV